MSNSKKLVMPITASIRRELLIKTGLAQATSGEPENIDSLIQKLIAEDLNMKYQDDHKILKGNTLTVSIPSEFDEPLEKRLKELGGISKTKYILGLIDSSYKK